MSETAIPINGRHRIRNTLWSVLGGLLLFWASGLSGATYRGVSFLWSLGDRVPSLETRVTKLEEPTQESRELRRELATARVQLKEFEKSVQELAEQMEADRLDRERARRRR